MQMILFLVNIFKNLQRMLPTLLLSFKTRSLSLMRLKIKRSVFHFIADKVTAGSNNEQLSLVLLGS